MSSDENKHEIGSFREEEEENPAEDEQPPEVLLIPVGYGDHSPDVSAPAELNQSNETENNRTPLVENIKVSVSNYSKLVKWLAVLEAMLTIFYLFTPLWPMIFTLFLAATGVVNSHTCWSSDEARTEGRPLPLLSVQVPTRDLLVQRHREWKFCH